MWGALMNLISKIILKIMDKFPQIKKDVEESFQKNIGTYKRHW